MAADRKEQKPQSTRRGPAIGRMSLERLAKKAEASTNVPAPSTSDTSATGTEKTETLDVNQWSSLFAMSTQHPFSDSTVWTLSPTGYVEQGCPKITDEALSRLTPRLTSRLETLAEGRGETLEDTVNAIVQFLSDNESPLLEGSLGDCVIWYLENVVVGD